MKLILFSIFVLSINTLNDWAWGHGWNHGHGWGHSHHWDHEHVLDLSDLEA